jgi:hypothetical protein
VSNKEGCVQFTGCMGLLRIVGIVQRPVCISLACHSEADLSWLQTDHLQVRYGAWDSACGVSFIGLAGIADDEACVAVALGL